MTSIIYACMVKIGKEYEAAEKLAEVCEWGWCARHLKPTRVGKSRKREWSEAPLWPGYVFATMTPSQFHYIQIDPHMKKLMHQTKLALGDGEARRLAKAVIAVDDQLDEAWRAVKRTEPPAVAFKPGQSVEVLEGILGGHRAMVRKIHREINGDYMAQIETETGGLPVWVPAADLRAVE